MTVDVDAVVGRLTAALATPAGRSALAAAVEVALAMEGAPTRPGGQPGVLRERWEDGRPLADDTDWDAPLGPFRDTTLARGTVGELCHARLSAGGFGANVVAGALAPFVEATGADLLTGALDEADRRDACVAAAFAALDGALRDLPLADAVVVER